MRTVLQRVKSASVTVDGQLISSIGKGLLVLAAVSKDDTEQDAEAMARKILKAKLWDDESKDPPGRPSFHKSASGEQARALYETFYKKVGQLYESDKVKDGVFAAMMDVALVNDGPVTIQIDTNPPKLEATSPGPPKSNP
ncbi:hypothetical protein GMOD_00001479 [Pyrenophora seminiperda CCB06]|uniref:D-aminoacyl-tRNA deacylase n=1 Tax=Pyrenophora seminiperda CCB06 TaxID=1302712 RepID=A0A3M7LZB2_9PLEO|nr:hypothetical protein GMOD_00001479 [Pyrenophora seminiperda CCB06]